MILNRCIVFSCYQKTDLVMIIIIVMVYYFDKLSFRTNSYLMIIGAIVILLIISNPLAKSFAGEPILVEEEIKLGNIDVKLVTENTNNDKMGLVKVSDIFRYNATLMNAYDEPIKFVFEPDMYVGIEKIRNIVKYEVNLEPQERITISVLSTMNHTGNINMY